MKLGCGITGLAVVRNYPKMTKRTGFCQRRPSAPILPIFGGHMRKIVNICHQSFNAKTDRLSFLFVMICEASLCYYPFGCGLTGLSVVRNSPKLPKKNWILSAVPIHADFADFCRSSAKKCEYFSSKFQCKNDRLSFLFEMTCETWLWHDRFGSGTSFPKSYRRGLNFVNSNIYRFWPKN